MLVMKVKTLPTKIIFTGTFVVLGICVWRTTGRVTSSSVSPPSAFTPAHFALKTTARRGP